MLLKDSLSAPSSRRLPARTAQFLQAGHILLALSLAVLTFGFSMSGWSQGSQRQRQG